MNEALESNKGSSLLDHAPMDMAELPEFFARLTGAQLRSVVVSAIIDAAERDGYEGLYCLDAALKAWRDHKDPGPRLTLRSAAERRRDPSPAATDDDLVAIALQAAPNLGDMLVFREVFEGNWHSVRAARVIRGRPEFEVFTGPRRFAHGKGALMAKRIA